jgi:uncharacterized protein (TIGR03437 family)
MRICLVLILSGLAFGQAPQIAQGGVVSAASWSSPIAPGEVIAIFGTNLAAPFGQTSVTINGIPAPVVFVSPGQINVEVPASLATVAAPNLAPAAVVVTTPAGSSTAEVAALAGSAPGLFTLDASGCGQVAALNVTPAGATSINSPANSAAPGDYVALFGTGFGPAVQQPADGMGPAGATTLQTIPLFRLDNNPFTSLSYAGLAPGLAGVDQINMQLPVTARNGCNVPVSAAGLWGGPTVTLSVQSGRGKCVDPPVQSYGTITLTRSASPASASTAPADAEFFAASFPSGPNVQPPAPEEIVFAPSWQAGAGLGTLIAIFSPAPINLRTCTVPGYANLSAGTIQIQPSSGSAAAVTPSSGALYSSLLPSGFIGPGKYALTGGSGGDVKLNSTLSVGSPIQLQTSFASGTVLSTSQPLTVKWTGGDPGTFVRVALISQGSSDYSYAEATAGSLTMQPQCTGSVCTFGLPLSTGVQISVSVLPAQPTSVNVPGVTGPVQLTWQYVYGFSGLTLTN